MHGAYFIQVFTVLCIVPDLEYDNDIDDSDKIDNIDDDTDDDSDNYYCYCYSNKWC